MKNYSSYEMFNVMTEYPAMLKSINVEISKDDDYNVTFVFLVYNGRITREFSYVCSNVYTDGKCKFKRLCENFVCLEECDVCFDDLTEEEKKYIRDDFDLNSLLGNYCIVTVIDIPDNHEIEYIVYPQLFEPEYYDEIESPYVIDLFDFKFDVNTDFDRVFSGQFKPDRVPDNINQLAKEIILNNNICSNNTQDELLDISYDEMYIF